MTHALQRSPADWNAAVIAEFHANGGEVAAPYPDPPPMLLLHTIGRRSGREHIVPMRCLIDGDGLYVFASAHGSTRHPDWYYNLITHPDIEIERGTETIPIRATEIHGAERDRIFALQKARFETFTTYERALDRTIPVIRLDRRDIGQAAANSGIEETRAENARVIEEFRRNAGKVGGRYEGTDLMILHTTGAKSGQERLTPLAYLRRDDRLYVFAANPERSGNPAWYHNLRANPDVTIEVGAETFEASTRMLEGEDRTDVFSSFVEAIPQLPEWQSDAGRLFPIIELTPKR